MRARALSILLLPAVLAGCTATGGSTAGFKGAKKDVAQVIADLSSDGQRRKPDDICNTLLSTKLRAAVAQGGQDCASEMKKAIEDADSFSLDVKAVTITGNTASAQVAGNDRGKDVLRTLRLVRQGGGWRIDSFG